MYHQKLETIFLLLFFGLYTNSMIGATNPRLTFFISENFKPEQIITQIILNDTLGINQPTYDITEISYITKFIPINHRPNSGRLASCGEILPFNDERSYFCITRETGWLMTTAIFSGVEGENYDLIIVAKDHLTSENITYNARISVLKKCFTSDQKFNAIITKECIPTSNNLIFDKIENTSARFHTPTRFNQHHVLSEVSLNGENLFQEDGIEIEMRVLGLSLHDERIDILKNVSFLSKQDIFRKALNTIIKLGNVIISIDLKGTQGPIPLTEDDISLYSFPGDAFCRRSTCLETIKEWKDALAKETNCDDTTKKKNLLQQFDLCNAPPQVRVDHPSPAFKDIYSPLSLKCEFISLRTPVIEWLKITNDREPKKVSQGDILDLPSVLLEDQGIFFCEVGNGVSKNSSDGIELLVNNVTSIMITMNIKNRDFTSELEDTSTKDFIDLESEIREPILSYLSPISNGRDSHFSVLKFRDSATDILVESKLQLQVFITEIRTSLVEKAYNLLKSGFARGLLESIEISNVSYSGPDACFPELSVLSNNINTVLWPISGANQTAKVNCPSSETEQAIRHCLHDVGVNLTYWAQFNNTQCIVNDPINTGIIDLTQKNITEENAREVSESLNQVTSNSSLLTPENVNSTLHIIDKVIDTGTTDNEVQTSLFETVNSVLATNPRSNRTVQEQSGFTTRVINTVDRLGVLSSLNESSGFEFVGTEIFVASFESTAPEENGVSLVYDPLKGLIIERGETNSTIDYKGNFFFLPPDVFEMSTPEDPVQVVSYYLPDPSVMLPPAIGLDTISPVFSTSVYRQNTPMTKLKTPVQYGLADAVNSTRQFTCVWYDIIDKTWNSSGCILTNSSDGGSKICECDHLTHFGLLFGADTSNLSELDKEILTTITYIGCGISLAGAFLTFITFLVFPHLRKSRPPKILMNLCAALIGMIIFFVAGVESTSNQDTCKILSMFLQYFFLSVFSWSFVEAGISFRGIVRPMAISFRRELLFAHCFGWGVPLLLTAIGAGVWWENYSDENRCVVHGLPFYVTVLPFIGIILIFNTFALVMILCAVTESSQRYSHTNLKFRVRCRIVFTFIVLFGLTWVFGFLVIDNDIVAFQYIFCILNSLHGLYIFLFYCVRNENVRLAWREHAFFDAARFRSAEFNASTMRRSRKQTQSTLAINANQQRQLREQHARYERDVVNASNYVELHGDVRSAGR